MTAMLTLQRRHSKKCRDQNKGPNFLKCRGHCPLRVCGTAEGRRVRISLKTRDLQRAARRITEIEDRASGKPRKSIADAIESFHAQHHGDQSETKRKYKRILGFFSDFCGQAEIYYVGRVQLEDMDRYALWRNKANWTWIKEVELLRQFFEFCRDREWTTKNPAKGLKRPIMIEANDIVPYTQNEIVRIIAACDQVGRSSYERRRARAMTLLMRYAGLRISDVVTLSREHIQGLYLAKRAVKNNKLIRVELPSAVFQA